MNFTQLNELLKSQKNEISLTEDVILDDSEEDILKRALESMTLKQLMAMVTQLMP